MVLRIIVTIARPGRPSEPGDARAQVLRALDERGSKIDEHRHKTNMRNVVGAQFLN